MKVWFSALGVSLAKARAPIPLVESSKKIRLVSRLSRSTKTNGCSDRFLQIGPAYENSTLVCLELVFVYRQLRKSNT